MRTTTVPWRPRRRFIPTIPTGFAFFAHDVTVLAGLRGSARRGASELGFEYSLSQRLNFLFQNLRGGFGPERANDFHNHSLRFWIAP